MRAECYSIPSTCIMLSSHVKQHSCGTLHVFNIRVEISAYAQILYNSTCLCLTAIHESNASVCSQYTGKVDA